MLPAGGISTFTVSLDTTGLARGWHKLLLSFASNDPDQPELQVALTGEGLVPPDIEVVPPALEADLYTGQVVFRLPQQGSGRLDRTFRRRELRFSQHKRCFHLVDLASRRFCRGLRAGFGWISASSAAKLRSLGCDTIG